MGGERRGGTGPWLLGCFDTVKKLCLGGICSFLRTVGLWGDVDPTAGQDVDPTAVD